MTRRLIPFALLALLALAPVLVHADDPPEPPGPPPAPGAAPEANTPVDPPADSEEPALELATLEEAEAAIELFKTEYRARGYRGDERTAMREIAMRRLAAVQHPLVADELAKLAKNRDADIRTLAVMYLGYQKALPGYAGPLVVKAMKSNNSDPVYVMFAIDALKDLEYRGAAAEFERLLKHKDEGVQKVAILAIGDMKEMRLLDALLKLMKDLKIDKGWKTEGGEVTYDTGTAGDHDQKMAEKIYREKYGSKAKKARSGGRAMRDMKPLLMEAMKRLTGEEFATAAHARQWAEVNADHVTEEKQALDEVMLAQATAAEALEED